MKQRLIWLWPWRDNYPTLGKYFYIAFITLNKCHVNLDETETVWFGIIFYWLLPSKILQIYLKWATPDTFILTVGFVYAYVGISINRTCSAWWPVSFNRFLCSLRNINCFSTTTTKKESNSTTRKKSKTNLTL